MDKEFVPYQQSLDMKELGFDEPCFAFFNTKFDESLCFVDLFGFVVEKTLEDFHVNSDESKTSAPTFSQAFKFFREKYKLTGLIEIGTQEFSYNIFDKKLNSILGTDRFNYNGTYKEAELSCIIKLIELVKSGSLKA